MRAQDESDRVIHFDPAAVEELKNDEYKITYYSYPTDKTFILKPGMDGHDELFILLTAGGLPEEVSEGEEEEAEGKKVSSGRKQPKTRMSRRRGSLPRTSPEKKRPPVVLKESSFEFSTPQRPKPDVKEGSTQTKKQSEKKTPPLRQASFEFSAPLRPPTRPPVELKKSSAEFSAPLRPPVELKKSSAEFSAPQRKPTQKTTESQTDPPPKEREEKKKAPPGGKHAEPPPSTTVELNFEEDVFPTRAGRRSWVEITPEDTKLINAEHAALGADNWSIGESAAANGEWFAVRQLSTGTIVYAANIRQSGSHYYGLDPHGNQVRIHAEAGREILEHARRSGRTILSPTSRGRKQEGLKKNRTGRTMEKPGYGLILSPEEIQRRQAWVKENADRLKEQQQQALKDERRGPFWFLKKKKGGAIYGKKPLADTAFGRFLTPGKRGRGLKRKRVVEN